MHICTSAIKCIVCIRKFQTITVYKMQEMRFYSECKAFLLGPTILEAHSPMAEMSAVMERNPSHHIPSPLWKLLHKLAGQNVCYYIVLSCPVPYHKLVELKRLMPPSYSSITISYSMQLLQSSVICHQD